MDAEGAPRAAGRNRLLPGVMADASSNDTPFGALAVDPAEGTVWGLAAGYGTDAEAKSVALEECGAGCEIVLTFEDGCMAYTADHAPGSTIIGWGRRVPHPCRGRAGRTRRVRKAWRNEL